ncbi:MAG: SRPBCC domain-containing protein [Deltaproteobacteria bacterium]|nr:SRPBCC domain-containing protein [Deltaproteobacteria bacterium]
MLAAIEGREGLTGVCLRPTGWRALTDQVGECTPDPPRRLVFTWCTSATDGATTLVTIELAAEGHAATNLKLTHEGLLKHHRRGWEGGLALLDRHAAALCAR